MYVFIFFYDHPAISCSDKSRMMMVQCPCGFPTILSRAYDHFLGPNDYLKSCSALTIRALCLYGNPVIYLRYAYGLANFKTCMRGDQKVRGK